MSASPLVAVVTPFYNNAGQLAGCIESVLAQTYSNWHYVLLDNCSTDGSSEIAKRYASRDERIELVEAKEFVGQLPNFNRALARIPPGAKYVKMVFGDDRLLDRCVEEMVALAERDESIVIVSAYAKVGRHIFMDGLPSNVEVLSGTEVFRHFVGDVSLFGSPTALLLRAESVRRRKPFFRESATFADADACFALLQDGSLGFVHQVLSIWGMDEGALTPELLRFRPGCLGRFLMAREYAHGFLPPGEARAAIRATRSAYYDDLAEELLRLPGSDFWRFHREALEGVGERIEWGRLIRHGALAALRTVLSAPYRAGRWLRHAVAGSRHATGNRGRPGR